MTNRAPDRTPFPDPFATGAAVGAAEPTVWPIDPFEGPTPEPTVVPPRPSQGPSPGGRRGDVANLAQGGLLSFGSTIVGAVLQFAMVAIVTRGFGVATAGVFFEVIGLFLILTNAAELGADAGVLRLIPRYRALHRTQDVRSILHIAFWPTLVAGVAVAAATWTYAPQLANLFFKTAHATDPRAVRLIRLFVPALPLSCVATALFSASRGFGAMLPTVGISNVGNSLFRAVAALAVVYLGLGIPALGLAWVIPVLVNFLVIIVWDRRLLQRAERRDRYDRQDRRRLRELGAEFWRFAAPRGLVGALSTTQLWLDTLLVGGLVSTTESAIYTASSRFVAISIFVIAALNIVIAPQLSSLLSLGEKRRAENVYHTATEWVILSSWPPTFVLATFAPLLLSLFGRQYVAGQTVLMTLSIGALFFLSTGPLGTVLVMGGKSGWSLLNAALSLSTNIGLNLLLVPKFGMNGAALAWALTGVVGQGSALIEVRVFLKLSPYHRRAFLAALASTVVYGGGGMLFRVLFGATIPSLLGYLAAATLVYAAFLWRFRQAFRLGELRRAIRQRGAERARTLQPA
jgi:O-antigen/teichoic acid export membrane protein